MGFGTFEILGLLLAVAGIKIIRQIYTARHEIFDANFTDRDRYLVSMLAFFVLVPISVLFHEGGHALAVWAFHGTITGFGFYFFAGYVSYVGYFTPVQQTLVALAGPLVNVLLAFLAFGILVGKRPPCRAPVNELLYQFAVISLANILIFYPLLDFAVNLDGDFRQMYIDGPRWLGAIILSCHAGILLAVYLASKNERFTLYLGRLTGMPPGVRRGLMGGFRTDGQTGLQRPVRDRPKSGNEKLIYDVVRRVASGWPTRVDLVFGFYGEAWVSTMQWAHSNEERLVAVVLRSEVEVVILGYAFQTGLGPIEDRPKRVLKRWPSIPSDSELTLALRMAMEQMAALPSASQLEAPVGTPRIA